MGRIFRIMVWFFLLCKRTLKRASFLAILGILPLLAIGVHIMSKTDSGVLCIAVAIGEEADEMAQQLSDSLFNSKSIMHYKRVSSETEARNMVETGKADAAWIIPDHLQQKIEDYVKQKEKYLLTVIEREDNVALHLSREILFGKMYEPIAYEIYRQYLLTELLPEADLQEDELRESFYRYNVEDNFFQFSYLDGNDQNLEDSYLLLPMRGFLALFVLMSGMAFSMYYVREKEQGSFVWTKMHSSVIHCWCYHIPEMLLVNMAVLLALKFTGVFENAGKEVLLLFLYSILVIGFCDVLQRLCGKVSIIGVLLPIVLLLSMLLAPIFLKIKGFLVLKKLLPVNYYLSAFHESNGIARMVIFIIGIYITDCILLCINKKIYHKY